MGLLEMIFKKPFTKTQSYFKMLDGYTPIYTSYNGGIYEMLQTKAIINTIASDCAKAIPQVAVHNARLEYMLKKRPNPFMSTSSFIERVVTNYLCDNNSFIIPMYDDFGRVNGLFPIQYSQVECLNYNGEIWLKYTFPNGEVGAIEYSKCGHLKRMQYKNDFFGDANNALDSTMQLLHTQNQSLQNALKQSGSIRFMAQLNEQLISKKDFEEERKLFSSVNFGSDNSQMMIYDSRYKDIKQVESKAIYLDEKQQALIDENLSNYFGVSKNVVQHNFTSDYEWNSYYEGVLEVILIKLGEEVTKILYTESQIQHGNEVFYSSNRLQYMSNESKLSFTTQMFDRGVINGDVVCDVWSLPHYEGGDKHYIRKEYAEISKLDDVDKDVDNVDNEIDEIILEEKGGEENGEQE